MLPATQGYEPIHNGFGRITHWERVEQRVRRIEGATDRYDLNGDGSKRTYRFHGAEVIYWIKVNYI